MNGTYAYRTCSAALLVLVLVLVLVVISSCVLTTHLVDLADEKLVSPLCEVRSIAAAVFSDSVLTKWRDGPLITWRGFVHTYGLFPHDPSFRNHA